MSDLERIFVVTFLGKVIPVLLWAVFVLYLAEYYYRFKDWFDEQKDRAWDALYRAYWRRQRAKVTDSAERTARE